MPVQRESGRYEVSTTAGEEVRAFLPHPLPPTAPPLLVEGDLQALLHRAERGLARLELAAVLVPSLDGFLYAFVRKEAVLSSRIEGTQATLVDLFTFEATEATGPGQEPDLEEVCNYLEALSYARDELRRKAGLPLSMRLLNEVHRRLMTGARGSSKRPGEVRRSQNWIGGSRPGNAAYVPPPPNALPAMLSDLERYLHADDDLAPLVRIALVHAQFESLHPYLDGNGRTGRMLITLLLEQWGLLGQPLLYLSLHFMRQREEYYARLDGVRQGDWEGWVDFFLHGVAAIAEEAVTTASRLFAQVNQDRVRVLNADSSSVMGLRLLELLPERPIMTAKYVMTALETTKPTAQKAVDLLEGLGILQETTGRKRDRAYQYSGYLSLLGSEEG